MKQPLNELDLFFMRVGEIKNLLGVLDDLTNGESNSLIVQAQFCCSQSNKGVLRLFSVVGRSLAILLKNYFVLEQPRNLILCIGLIWRLERSLSTNWRGKSMTSIASCAI